MSNYWPYDPTPYDDYFRKYGAQYGIDPHRLRAQAYVESRFNPAARSPVGARGLMQIMEPTAGDYGITDMNQLDDPETSVRVAAQHRAAIKRRRPDWTEEQIDMAYNAGEGNMLKHNLDPPFKETQGYRDQIKSQLAPRDDIIKKARAMLGIGQDKDSLVKKARALLAAKDTPSTPKLGDYTQYPKGSKEYFQAVTEQGGLPAVRPTKYQEGETLPGVTQPFEGHSVDRVYPAEYKARLVEVVDNDTMLVEEMGTGDRKYVRFPDVQGAEKGTETGASQKEYMRAFLKPGDDLTINSPSPGEDKGVYGRDLGRVYWHDRQGHTVDLSKPYDLQKDTESKPGEGDPGWWQGLSRSALLELPEFTNFGFGIADWINGDTDLDQDNKFHNWAIEKEEKWRNTMERFMAYGYDTDGPSVNVPFMGEMRAGEMARFLGSGAAYTAGVTFAIGKALKAGTASFKTVNMLSKSSRLRNLDDIAKHSEFAKRIRAKLVEAADTGGRIDKHLNERLDETIKFHGELDKWSHELVEASPKLSAVERLRLYKDLFVSHWSDKYHPMVQVARQRSKGEADVFQNWLNQIKASSDVASSPIHQNVRAWYVDENGQDISKEVYQSLRDIWQGVSATTHREAGMYMAFQRLTRDLWPEWQKALKAAGGSEAKAIATAKKEGRRLIPVRKETVDEAQGLMTKFNEMHTKDGDLVELHARMADTRTWAVHSILNPLLEVNAITRKSYDQILDSNQHYAPFMRVMIETIEDKQGRDAVMDILRLEGDMSEAGAKVSSFIKGAGETATTKVPLGRLTKAIDPEDMKQLIVDPFQAFYTRGMAIQKYVNQQRIRNMLGRLMDDTIEASDTGFSQWIAKTTRKTTDPKEVEAILNSGMSGGFVRLTKEVDDLGAEKIIKTGYMTADPALSQAIGAMSPSQMGLFKGMMQHSIVRALAKPTQIFRGGTVLGLHFMIRNPFRDQFMAAALTKYGYTPVIDWWKGLFGVLTKHPVYQAMHGAGATQANFTAATLKETTAGINEITTGRTLSKFLNDINTKPDGGAIEKSKSLQNMGGIGGLRQAIANSQEHFAKRAQGTDFSQGNFVKRGAKMAYHSLRRVSEIFEEATRTGAGMKAVRRAQKGKKYTVSRALDEAAGGFSGYPRLLFDKGHRAGFKSRWQRARHVSETQRKAAVAAKKSGKAELDADMIDEIRNITLDFQRRGDWGETVNAFYPFFNAELQDYARFSRALREAPMSTMMRGFAFVSVPAIASWYLNFDNPLYRENVPDIEKELFIHPWGYDERYKKFGRIPRPVGTVSGAFSLLPHKILDYLAANDPSAIKALEETLWPGKSMREARDGWLEGAHQASEALPPWATALAAGASMGNLPMYGVPDPSGMPRDEEIIGPLAARGEHPLEYAKRTFTDYLGSNTAARYVMPEDKSLGGIANTAAPQFAAPFTQLLSNEDPFFRSPIEPWSLRNKKLLAADRFTEHTSPIEHALSKMIPWDTSPIEAGHLVRRTTGSLGSMLMAAADNLGQATGMFPDRPGVPKDPTDSFLPKAFFSKEPFGSNSQPVRELYRVWDEQQRVLNSMQHNIKLGTATGVERAKDIMRDHPEWIAAQVVKAGVEDLSAIHKARRQVKSSLEISDAHRADILFAYDQYMTQQAYIILTVYQNLIRKPSIVGDLLSNDED